MTTHRGGAKAPDPVARADAPAPADLTGIDTNNHPGLATASPSRSKKNKAADPSATRRPKTLYWGSAHTKQRKNNNNI